MKKKFLSLMMAAAVVATTSVSAFAESLEEAAGGISGDVTTESTATPEAVPGGVIKGEDNKEYTTDVTITGDVANDKGHTKPGTLSVTVPTAANFNVSKEGVLNGTKITITNSGKQKVDVIAYKFRDVNGTQGINIQPERDIATGNETKDRNNISLKLIGTTNVAYFKSVNDNSAGVFSNPELTGDVGNDYKIAEVNPNGGTVDLELKGTAGGKKTGIPNPMQENFTLVLKVKKSTT